MQKQSVALVGMLILLALVTLINYFLFSHLGITSITLLYLLVVVTGAYFCELLIASVLAVLAFLAINYFFTEPRFTFEVAHVESWASLVCFLIVSMVIASLVKQLKFQTTESLLASKEAKFARTLAENLALASNIAQLYQDTCRLLQAEFSKPIAIIECDANKTYTIKTASAQIETPDHRLLNWVSDHGKPISPYTDYWVKSSTKNQQWLLPFSRLPSQLPILVVSDVSENEPINTYAAIKSAVDQISQAYERLTSIETAKSAEFRAQEEAIQSALLASISHDMRTPLTSILGAATTLQQPDLSSTEASRLTDLIASQARYLASTTENILSLIRLESTQTQTIAMDWQSPEELIGVVTALYKSRDETLNLIVSIHEPELLIKGNANLLIQALVNLIDNAKQVSAENDSIEIVVSQANERIDISVNDHGSGFDAGFTAENIKKFSSTNAKGFGLGLSIVQAIATMHRANLTIQNRDSGGASVTLSFPAMLVDINHAQ